MLTRRCERERLASGFPVEHDALSGRSGSVVVFDGDLARPGAARDSYLALFHGEPREVAERSRCTARRGAD